MTSGTPISLSMRVYEWPNVVCSPNASPWSDVMITSVFSRSPWLGGVEQATQLLIEGGDAVIVAVAGHLDVPQSEQALDRPHIFHQESMISRELGPDSELAEMVLWRKVRLVGVEVVQEGEEGAIRPAPTQPREEGLVELVCMAGLQVDPLPVEEATGIQDVLEDPLARNRASEQGPRRQRVVFVMGKPPRQPALITTAVGVCREPGGLIAA